MSGFDQGEAARPSAAEWPEMLGRIADCLDANLKVVRADPRNAGRATFNPPAPAAAGGAGVAGDGDGDNAPSKLRRPRGKRGGLRHREQLRDAA